MFVITQTRHRKESLIPIRSTLEDLKIEILDVNTMGEFTFIDSGCEQMVEVMTSEDSDSNYSGGRPRKRAKLDHLSSEQKAQHRKMMNRISAQTARDRQRALMVQQEDSLKLLSASMNQLEEENRSLKKKNETLVVENESLKGVTVENERLKSLVSELENKLKCQEVCDSIDVPSRVSIETNCSSSEPAVPTIPLLKELKLQMILIFTLLIWEYCHGISTLQKFSKPWKTFQKKSLAKTPRSELLTLREMSAQEMRKVTFQKRLKPPD